MTRLTMLPALIVATLAACGNGPESPAAAEPAIDVERLTSHLQVLASDEFEGRGPSSPGEKKTVEYIRDRFEEYGLQPGNAGDWFQGVPLVAITADPAASLDIAGVGGTQTFGYRDDMVVWTKRVVPETALDSSELVFVGYGIVAPEYGWNDYDGLDVRGKTVVILVNDPGYATEDASLFRGRTMTYYGRWTYKYEEAARQGAAGALVIHETGAAGYGWQVVQNSWTGPQFDLDTADGNAGRVAVEGWISGKAADSIFTAAGQDLAALTRAAESSDFEAVPLGLTASVGVQNTIEKSVSRNVIGYLPGAERPEETILLMAHWDHLGRDPNAEGDGIYNGAVDNASGTAALLELARVLGSAPERPARSYVFAAVTAEESGLLGSAWFAEHPSFPLETMVAGLNMDGMNVLGRTRDVVVIGSGNSELEYYLSDAVKSQGRVMVREPFPEKGYFFRSDHFNLAKKGVPVLYAESGIDYVDGGRDWGRAQSRAYLSDRYHKPGDEFDPAWDLSGAVEDMQLYLQIARRLADEESFPNWIETSEFRPARDATAGARP